MLCDVMVVVGEEKEVVRGSTEGGRSMDVAVWSIRKRRRRCFRRAGGVRRGEEEVRVGVGDEIAAVLVTVL